jgi:hypothetical protein
MKGPTKAKPFRPATSVLCMRSSEVDGELDLRQLLGEALKDEDDGFPALRED